LAHLDDRDQRGVLIEWRERSAQVVRLSHGAPIGCRCRAKVACPCRSPHSIYKRNGTTTLFAALNILDGTVVGRCMPSHTHKEFIKFLNAVERAVRPGRIIHAIADNYATHKHPKVTRWLADHPRWVFHFTPTSASWLNAVEGFFSIITRRQIRRGVFKSVADLENAIRRYIREHNQSSKPFLWTKPADTILAKLSRLPVPSQ
jgi:transposase